MDHEQAKRIIDEYQRRKRPLTTTVDGKHYEAVTADYLGGPNDGGTRLWAIPPEQKHITKPYPIVVDGEIRRVWKYSGVRSPGSNRVTLTAIGTEERNYA